MNLPDYMLTSPDCSYHQLIHLDKEGKHQVNSSCYKIADMQTVPWFVLPPVEAWYYSRRNPTYASLPPYLPQCATADKRKLFALIYPAQYARVHIPIEQDGQPGRVVFEATHENSDATIFWHLDDEYLGATQHRHQMAISAKAGKHVLTLVDDQGNVISQPFEVIN